MPELERLRDVALFGVGAAAAAWIVRTAMAVPPPKPVAVAARIAWRPLGSSPVEASLPPVADTFAHETFPDANFGGSATLDKEDITPGSRRWAYLKFDLGGIPEGSTIISARIRTYAEGHFEPTTLNAYHCHNDAWTEYGLTWANRPARDELLGSVAVPGPGAPAWVEVDVTPAVQEDFATDKVTSLVLTGGSLIHDGSKESATPPELVVEYEPVAPPAILGYIDVDVRATAGVAPLEATVAVYVDGALFGELTGTLAELDRWYRFSFPYDVPGDHVAYAEAYAVDAAGVRSPTVRTAEIPFTAGVAPVVEAAIGWTPV